MKEKYQHRRDEILQHSTEEDTSTQDSPNTTTSVNDNCHTLILSEDHLFVGVRPLLDHFEVLDTHRYAIREVPRHVSS